MQTMTVPIFKGEGKLEYEERPIPRLEAASYVTIYKESQGWPADERFGLISQVRRATTAIPLNIAEGAGNSSNKEFTRFLQYALRSTYEVMTAIDIARGLNFLPDDRADPLIEEADQIAAMLVGLMKSLGWKSPGR